MPEPQLAVEGLALDVVPDTLGTPVGIPLPRSVLVLEVAGAGLVYRGALIVPPTGPRATRCSPEGAPRGRPIRPR